MIEDREALTALLIENRRRDHPVSAYLFDPEAMADAILASDWLAAQKAAAVEAALAPVRALHTGLHRCTDGWYWIEVETPGCKGANVGLCPTRAVLPPAPTEGG